MNTTWLTTTLTSLDEIMNNIQNLTGVMGALDELPTLSAIREMLPELQLFLADSGPEQLYQEYVLCFLIPSLCF